MDICTDLIVVTVAIRVGRTGGNDGLTTHQLEYDIAIPVLESITPDTTAMNHYFKTTAGSSLIQNTAGAHPGA